MRIVLDTNVLISAFLFEKRLGKIVKLIEQGGITPCFLITTFQEFRRVLAYEKFKPLLETAHTSVGEIIERLYAHSVILEDPEIIPDATADAPDNYILAAAQSANAQCVVTGDKLLLALKRFNKIPIIKPEQFLRDF